MGSTGWYTDPGQSTNDAIREYVGADRVIDMALKGGVAYIAYRSALNEQIVALVMPYTKRDGYLVVKDQDETMGPYAADCPARILDQLDPTDYQYAQEWRAKCRANLARREAAKQVKPGMVIETAAPVSYGKRYGEFRRFRFEKGSTFTALDGTIYRSLRVQLTNWRTMDYQIVEEVAA